MINDLLKFEEIIFKTYPPTEDSIFINKDIIEESRKAELLLIYTIGKVIESKTLPLFFHELPVEARVQIIQNFISLRTYKTARINSHDCLDCTLKHLSSAIVQMGELQKGWWGTDHEIFCMGNLAEASEQIAGYSLDIANKLRDLRRDIFETKKDITKEHIDIGKSLYWQVKDLKNGKTSKNESVTLDLHNKPSNFIVHKPCGGCGKNKGNQIIDNVKTPLDNQQ